MPSIVNVEDRDIDMTSNVIRFSLITESASSLPARHEIYDCRIVGFDLILFILARIDAGLV